MVRFHVFFVDVTKEEEWINKYIRKGYHLDKVTSSLGMYEFSKADENKSNNQVKMDFRTFSKQEEFNDYITMFEDSGWKHISGNKSEGMQYFEKISTDATEDIYSDYLSRAERNKRISKMYFGFLCSFFPILVVFWCNGIFSLNKLFNLKEQYLTPGLWEMSGSEFWFSLIFETPFALARSFSGWLFFLILISFGILGIKAHLMYKKDLNKTLES